MEGFQAIDYIDWDPTPQQSTDQLNENIEEILASTPLRGTLQACLKIAEIEKRYVGAMATEILLRGDSRSPEEIRAAGGFRLRVSETGRYHINVDFHTNSRVPRESPTGFISTGRSMQIALEAVQAQEASPGNGWVYAALARGVDVRASGTYHRIQRDEEKYNTAMAAVREERDYAHEIQAKDKKRGDDLHDDVDIKARAASDRYPMAEFTVYRQAEVAVPTEIPWEHVLGFRQVEKGRLTGPLYLRKEFLDFKRKVKREVPAFKTPLGVEVYREKYVARLGGQPVRQNPFGITLATVARLSDLFQVSLDRRLLPHQKGYVVSGFPLFLNQNWMKLEKEMPFMRYFEEASKARGALPDGALGSDRSVVYLYEFDKDAYSRSGIELEWIEGKSSYWDSRIKVDGATANLRRLLYVFRKMESRMVRR